MYELRSTVLDEHNQPATRHT